MSRYAAPPLDIQVSIAGRRRFCEAVSNRGQEFVAGGGVGLPFPLHSFFQEETDVALGFDRLLLLLTAGGLVVGLDADTLLAPPWAAMPCWQPEDTH